MRQIRYLTAVAEALEQEMEADPSVFVLGEDVRQSVRGITIGFLEKFGPNRVIDTPISEQATHAIAIGAAVRGLRPVIEYQINSFVYFAFEQLVDQAQKFHYMSAGTNNVPITLLVPGSGASSGNAGQHSDHNYPYMLHAGIKVVLPSSPYDAKGLLVSAIRDDDPVMVFLPARLLTAEGDVPVESYAIPMGCGEIKREGSDVTVVATGHLVAIALGAAAKLESEGVSLEVFDPRSLLPLDKDSLLASVSKTGRVVIFDDSNRTCGFAAEVSSIVGEEAFSDLKAPVRIVARPTMPVPFSPPLEEFVLPNEEKLLHTIRKTMASNYDQ